MTVFVVTLIFAVTSQQGIWDIRYLSKNFNLFLAQAVKNSEWLARVVVALKSNFPLEKEKKKRKRIMEKSS